jgi:hypothetical protein
LLRHDLAFYLQRGSEHYLVRGTAKSHGRSIAEV